MDKDKLLDGIQIALDHLDEAAEGEHEIANLLNAVSHLNDVLAAVVYSLAETNERVEKLETLANDMNQALEGVYFRQ